MADSGEELRIGKYSVSERLGKGGMGEVWRGIHPELELPVAIKTLSAVLLERDPSFVERFLKEARTAARLNHPNVVRVYDAGVDDDVYFIVMELVEGGDVSDLMKQNGGPLPTEQALDIIIGATEGLKAAAAYSIIHRDIKPDNIMLDSHGTPKLADLGLAKETEGEDVSMTATGMAMGTPSYMAPEQVTDAKNVDTRADIYSLGATFYQLVTGVLPFTGKSSFAVMSKHVNEPLSHPQTRNPDLPDSICAVICKMMEKNPADRYQSATELLEELQRIKYGGNPLASQMGTVASAVGTPPPQAPPAGEDTRRPTHTPPKHDRNLAAFAAKAAEASQASRDRENVRKTPKDAPKKSKRLPLILGGVAVCVAGVLIVAVMNNREEPAPPAPEQEVPRPESASAQKTAGPAFGQLWTVPEAGIEMVPIEPATFQMGSINGTDDERPVHSVTLTKPFWIGKYEVTWEELCRLRKAGTPIQGRERNPGVKNPWVTVSRMCARLTDTERQNGRIPEGYAYRLPTEAEWEYCCRAGKANDSSWKLGDVAWYKGNAGQEALQEKYNTYHSVGGKHPNAWGLYDVHGGAWEWCYDVYSPTAYAQSPLRDPCGPSQGTQRVIRGGSVASPADECRSASRKGVPPDTSERDIGWRIALAPEISQPQPPKVTTKPTGRPKQRYEGIFPIALHGVLKPPRKLKDETTKKAWNERLVTAMKDTGFNALAGTMDEHMITLARERGMSVITGGRFEKQLGGKALTAEQAQSVVSSAADLCERHSNIIGAFMYTDPVNSKWLPNWRVLGAAWNERCPDVPLLACYSGGAQWQAFDEASPIAAANAWCYVFRPKRSLEESLEHPMFTMDWDEKTGLDDARAKMPDLPVWSWIAAIRIEMLREPTPAELSVALYNGLAEGVRGGLIFRAKPTPDGTTSLLRDDAQPGSLIVACTSALRHFRDIGKILLPYRMDDTRQVLLKGKGHAGAYVDKGGNAKYIMLASKDVENAQTVTLGFTGGSPEPQQLRDALDGKIYRVIVREGLAGSRIDLPAASGRLLEVIR